MCDGSSGIQTRQGVVVSIIGLGCKREGSLGVDLLADVFSYCTLVEAILTTL